MRTPPRAPRTPVILVHGGAGTVGDELHDAALDGVRAAAALGQRALLDGEDAVTAAVRAVRLMEDDPAFNAGRGACLNDGEDDQLPGGVVAQPVGPAPRPPRNRASKGGARTDAKTQCTSVHPRPYCEAGHV